MLSGGLRLVYVVSALPVGCGKGEGTVPFKAFLQLEKFPKGRVVFEG